MRHIHILFLSLALLGTCAFAQEPADELTDFTFPVPGNFTTSASEALKTHGKDLTYFLKSQGILFPADSKAELDTTKNILTVRIPHQEALNLLQIINSCVGKEGDESAKAIFGLNQTHQEDCRCFGPAVDEAKANKVEKK